MTRMYALFTRKRGTRNWTQVSNAYSKETAIRVFQDRLIAGAFDPDNEQELRPTKMIQYNT